MIKPKPCEYRLCDETISLYWPDGDEKSQIQYDKCRFHNPTCAALGRAENMRNKPKVHKKAVKRMDHVPNIDIVNKFGLGL